MNLAKLVRDQEFVELFVEELGWDRFVFRTTLSFTALGHGERFGAAERRSRQIPRRKWTFDVEGIAQKRGQAAMVVRTQEFGGIPTALARYSLYDRLTRFHVAPLVVFVGRETERQVWSWTEDRTFGALPFSRTFEPKDPDGGIVSRLPLLRFSLDEEGSVDLLEAQRRVAEAIRYFRVRRRLQRQEVPSAVLQSLGHGLLELGELAAAHRGLQRDDERVLVEMARDGNRSAQDRLVLAHLYLAFAIAWRRNRQHLGHLDYVDMVSEGVEGIVKAATTFDGTQSPRFMTFASMWVSRMLDRLSLEDRLIRFPVHMSDDLKSLGSRFEACEAALTANSQSWHDEAQVAHLAGFRPRDLVALQLWRNSPVSVDDVQMEEQPPRFTTLAAVPSIDSALDDVGTDHPLLACLKPKERALLVARLDTAKRRRATLDELAGVLGVTRERVRQMELEAKRKVREHFDGVPPNLWEMTTAKNVPVRQRRRMPQAPKPAAAVADAMNAAAADTILARVGLR